MVMGIIFISHEPPQLFDPTQFDLNLFKRVDIDNFEMQRVEFKTSELETSKCAEL